MAKCLFTNRLFWINLIVVVLLMPFGRAMAQDKLSGQVFEDNTAVPIAGITVENLSSRVKGLSDKDGHFMITAKPGELLSFSSLFYETDTVYVANLKFLKVGLRLKGSALKEVKVRMTNFKARKGSFTYHSPTVFNDQTVLFNTDDSGHYLDGVRIMLHTSKSEEKKRARLEKFVADENTKDRIAKLFSPENLKKYVPITSQELTNFIVLYTPDVKAFNDKGFNFLAYVADSYKEFKKLPESERKSAGLTKLPTDIKVTP